MRTPLLSLHSPLLNNASLERRISLSPTGFPNSRNLAWFDDVLAEAGHFEPPQKPMNAPAQTAPVIATCREFRFGRGLISER
jgi:hypothetical protein